MDIQVNDVSKIYGTGENRVVALCHANMTIHSGDFISIMGPSGSGKSTLLHIISGLDTPTSGKVLYGDTDIHHGSDKELSAFRRQKIGVIFQQFNLLPVLTAQENIIMLLLLDKRQPDNAYLQEIAAFLGIDSRLNHLPHELSGGQQQRVAIARALIAKPDIIFADEPTGSVALVQHYPKIIPVMLLSRSTRISDMTERQSVRFSSRVRESYMLLKSVCNILSTAEKSGGVSSGASSGICCRAAVYIW